MCHLSRVSCWKKGRAPAVSALLLLLLPSCERVQALLGEKEIAQVSPTYPVQIVALGDGDKPLAGVQVLSGKRTVGTTDGSGSVRLSLEGSEGDVVALSV